MKYALVTGSTKGIGKATADLLAQNGYLVLRNGRGESDSNNYIQADLSDMAEAEKLVERTLEYTDKLDCIVFNAGATCRKAFEDIEYEDWQKVMDTNVNIPFMLAKRLYKHMAENGTIIFIGSAMALKPHATSIPYGVSKAAINMMAQCLAREFASKKVRVNVICPGFIDTEWQKEKPEWLREKIADKTALNRFGTPEEVAQMCVSLCENSYVNGAVISVDGGYDLMF